MNILYLPIDERQCNSRLPTLFLSNNSKIELNTIPIKYMGRMKNQGDINGVFSYLEEKLPFCDVAILSFELLMYGGYLPSRVHLLSNEQLNGRFQKIESLLRRKKRKTTKVYLFSNMLSTTQYSSSENDCNYYSNYGEFIYKRSYLLDKKSINTLDKIEEKELSDCIKMLPASVIRDYEHRVNVNKNLVLDCARLIKCSLIDSFSINLEDDCKYGYKSIAKKEISAYFKQQKVDDRVLQYFKVENIGFDLICRAIVLYFNNIIRIAVVSDDDINNLLTIMKENKLQRSIELLGAVYTKNLDECDLIVFVHANKYNNISLNDNTYKSLIKKSVPFVVVDEVFNDKVDSLFVRSMFKKGISNNLLSYSRTLERALASALIQYQFGTKELRDNVLFDAMIYEYAFKSCVRDKYAKILENRSIGKLIHINDNDVELKIAIKHDIESELIKLYKTLPYTIKEISFPWYRLDEILIIFK